MLMELIKAGLPEEQIKELEERMRKDKEFKESEAKYEALLERIERLDIDLKNKQNAVNQKSDERREFNVAKELAKIAGISHDTMHKIETIEQKASEEIKQKLKTGDISINQAYIQVKNERSDYIDIKRHI